MWSYYVIDSIVVYGNQRNTNLSAITVAQENTYHARTKHINIAYHFTRQVIANNEASLTHVPTQDNPADLLTKSLDATKHEYLRRKMGLE